MPQKGLSEKEVLKSQEKYGKNVIPEKDVFLVFNILVDQFKSPLTYIILIAAVISLFLKEYIDAILIFVLIFFNVLMGFIQEYKAQKTLIALKKFLSPKTLVIREGKVKKIMSSEVVAGDIVVLTAGEGVPADGKLTKSINLLVNEAILTGESEAVLKSISRPNNAVFMGTTVLSGHGIMEITKVGSQTEVGKISQTISAIKEEKTPLQKKMGYFSGSLAYLILLIAVVIFLVGVLTQQDVWHMLEISIILAIAAIPEALPIAVTVILALGMSRILKKNGLVKRLLSMETLGTASVICADKTGTLTEGNMRVVKIDFRNKKNFLTGLAITNEQKNNVEVAIWDYLKNKSRIKPEKIFSSKKTIYEEPFDSERKYKMVVANLNSHEGSFILGAPEIIMEMCKINEKERKAVIKKIERWAKSGLRVIGLISKEKGDLRSKGRFKWLGLVGIEDPIRKDVKRAIKTAQRSGIDVRIITGDYIETAKKIAFNLGFRLKEKNILEGRDLELMSEEELREKVDGIYLFARITPRQKLRIINALQENGEVVAMTGDGVNDGPALKKADIGIVVGDASEVAKESADLILLDSNFKTIIAACEEGRRIFANIKKVVAYVLSNSFVEMFLIFGAILMRLPMPLTIVQILWIHLICDGPLDIVLGFESKRKSLESEDPHKIKNEQILNAPMKVLIFIISFTVGMVSLALFYYFLNQTKDVGLSRTIALTIVGSVDIIYIFAFKDLTKPIFKIEKFFKNKYLLWSVVYSVAILFAGVYIPYLNGILGTIPLPARYWLIPLAVGLLSIVWVEMVKYIANRKLRG